MVIFLKWKSLAFHCSDFLKWKQHMPAQEQSDLHLAFQLTNLSQYLVRFFYGNIPVYGMVSILASPYRLLDQKKADKILLIQLIQLHKLNCFHTSSLEPISHMAQFMKTILEMFIAHSKLISLSLYLPHQ